MTNILALSISIFTMTVYDRVIPNAAIESLIALTVGVVIALGFDFLIRYIRALFIDQASRIADYDVSVRIFDRILSLSATEYTLKKGCWRVLCANMKPSASFSHRRVWCFWLICPLRYFFSMSFR